MEHKESYIKTAIAVTITLAATLSGYLLSDWEKWETTLIPYLLYKWAIQLLTISLILLSLALPFWFSGMMSPGKRLKRKGVETLIETIEDIVRSEYRIHQINILDKKIKDAVNNEAIKGARIPQGSLKRALSDIFLGEIEIFSKMLQLAVNMAIANIEKRNILNPIGSTIEKLLNQHKENVLEMYMGYIHFYFPNEPIQNFYTISKESFLKVAEAETDQRIQHINSLVKLEIFT